MVASNRTLAKNRPTYDTRVPDEMRCRYEYILPDFKQWRMLVVSLCTVGCFRLMARLLCEFLAYCRFNFVSNRRGFQLYLRRRVPVAIGRSCCFTMLCACQGRHLSTKLGLFLAGFTITEEISCFRYFHHGIGLRFESQLIYLRYR